MFQAGDLNIKTKSYGSGSIRLTDGSYTIIKAGGRIGISNIKKIVETYDPVTRVWKTKNGLALPFPTLAMGTVVNNVFMLFTDDKVLALNYEGKEWETVTVGLKDDNDKRKPGDKYSILPYNTMP